jgi:acylphosphatase
MAELMGARILVKGVVQGVGYREFVERKAPQYDLKGYVKNLLTGEVEVVVEGEKGLIIDFIGDLRVGPRGARVADVVVHWKPYGKQFDRFGVRW